MKKHLFLWLLMILFFSSQAQINRRYNRPFFGLNIGATYQQSDVRDIPAVGWGFTFGKYYNQSETGMFDFGWRLRYLHGNTLGVDSKRYSLQGNENVISNLEPDIQNYYTDTLGYIYNNYKMTLDEGAFEVMFGLNRLREKTRIVLYGFGGIGLSGWQTKINQKNGSNKYDYLKIDSAGNAGASSVLNALENMYDNSYETDAFGNTKYKIHFVPSVGIGLGWQTKRGHYWGLEHRITFTQTDAADGVEASSSSLYKNDLYDYTGIFVRWMIGGGTASSHPTTKPAPPDVYTHHPPPPPTYTGTPTYTTTVVTPPPPPPPPVVKPAVVIHYPAQSPFTVNTQAITVTASVFGVYSRNEIAVQINGAPTQNFVYDVMNKALMITSTLNPGNNTFYISASNPAGYDWKSASVIYNQGAPPPQTQKPVVTITYPVLNPFTTNQNNVTVTGTVVNVNSRNDITVYINGNINASFQYNNSSKVITVPATNLALGNNVVSITAVNSAGSDSKGAIINYQTSLPDYPKPVVTFVSPSANPYSTSAQPVSVKADIKNVKAKEDITVSVNNNKVNFTFSSITQACDFSAPLVLGNNVISVSAKNAAGSDSKMLTIIYSSTTGGGEKPKVTITNPAANPFNTAANTVTVLATVENVPGKENISVKVNHQSFPAVPFVYNPSAKTVSLTANLQVGNNLFEITGTNQFGSDSKSVTVVYSPKTVSPPPVIKVIVPASSPFVTGKNNEDILATVLNVNSKNEISVKVNNAAFTNFSYSSDNKNLSLNTPLQDGTNVITLTASNSAGTDSKTITIKYTAPPPLPLPVITITYPTANPFITGNANITITATVLNVASKESIKITGPGNVQFSNFSYNTSSKTLTFATTLNSGANPFTITATNPQGSDSKSITIKYESYAQEENISTHNPKGQATGGQVSIGGGRQKPVITFTNPSTNPASASNPTVSFAATVSGVVSKSDITVKVNGNALKSFNYDSGTKILSFSYNFSSGSGNTVTIEAKNTAGTESKTITVNVN